MSVYMILPTHSPNQGRELLNKALVSVTPAGLMQQVELVAGEEALIPAARQLLVYGQFVIGGVLTIEGELVLL